MGVGGIPGRWTVSHVATPGGRTTAAPGLPLTPPSLTRLTTWTVAGRRRQLNLTLMAPFFCCFLTGDGLIFTTSHVTPAASEITQTMKTAIPRSPSTSATPLG